MKTDMKTAFETMDSEERQVLCHAFFWPQSGISPQIADQCETRDGKKYLKQLEKDGWIQRTPEGALCISLMVRELCGNCLQAGNGVQDGFENSCLDAALTILQNKSEGKEALPELLYCIASIACYNADSLAADKNADSRAYEQACRRASYACLLRGDEETAAKYYPHSSQHDH